MSKSHPDLPSTDLHKHRQIGYFIKNVENQHVTGKNRRRGKEKVFKNKTKTGPDWTARILERAYNSFLLLKRGEHHPVSPISLQ